MTGRNVNLHTNNFRYHFTFFGYDDDVIFLSMFKGPNLKFLVLLHPPGRKIPLLSCVRYVSIVPEKPCCTKLPVVNFS